MADLLIQLSLSQANHLQQRAKQGTGLHWPACIISLISERFLVCRLSICLLVYLSVDNEALGKKVSGGFVDYAIMRRQPR